MKKYLSSLILAVGFCLLAPVSQAQQSIPVKIYPLTNAPSAWLTNGTIATNMIVMTNGFSILSSNCTYIVTSQPFQIWRGRGFGFNVQLACTNGNSSVCTFNFRFATVHPNTWTGTTLVTNWSTTSLVAIAVTGNGTTAVNLATNIPPTIVDNYTLGQLYSIGVSTIATATQLDPTNTFISVYP